MAINTQTPILPVGINGAFSVKPKNRWWMKPGSIVITIGKPIYINKQDYGNINNLMKIVEKEIKPKLWLERRCRRAIRVVRFICLHAA